MKESQNQMILAYMKSGKSITPLEALNLFGCFRLGARCFELKAKGVQIKSEFVTLPNQKKVKRYWID
jgi:hypothetical protein